MHELDSILEAKGEKIDRVLLLVADNDELVERLLNRAAEQGRTDDNEEVIRLSLIHISSAKTDEEGRAILKALGFPFKTN